MTDTRFTDRAAISGVHRHRDGYLVAEAFVAREGVQLYRGSEVGMADRDVVRVWRPESEVKAGAGGYSHAPVTMGHPAEFVTADNWASLAKGEVSTEAEWKDGKLRLPLIVKDAAAIAAIEGGTRQLSAGYLCALDWTAGTTPSGEAYDAVQRSIVINHVAIVPAGRAGPDCRIGDEAATWGASPVNLSDAKEDRMSDPLKTVVLGDKAVQVLAADASLIDAYKAAQDQRLADAETAHASAIAAKDEALGTLKAELQAAKDAAVTPEKLTRLIADRVALEATVKGIDAALVPDGLTDAALRKAAVKARLGDEAIADASDAEISGMFRVLARDAKADPVAAAIRDGVTPATTLDQEYAARNARLTNAWQQPQRKEA